MILAFVRTENHLAGLAFQEYHPSYPHIRGSLGYAGRPGGPEFYISLVDNTDNHGPGSQGSKTEADGCFARVVEGWDDVVVCIYLLKLTSSFLIICFK